MTKSLITLTTNLNVLFCLDHNSGKIDIARPVRIELI